MSSYENYVFLLCFTVYVLLTLLSIVSISWIVKLIVRLIRHGAEDERIKREYLIRQKNKGKKGGKVFENILTAVFCTFLLCVFGVCAYINIQKENFSDKIPTFSVVKSASMAKKNEKNTYLFKHNLNNQFNTHDLLLTYKAPSEKDLKLYDIVVYEVDGKLVVHRIVDIEEPNSKHPNERYFLCQGDAVETPDRFPVRYTQIKGIYRGERIAHIGSLVSFMQSPAGWICIILVVVMTVATPMIEKKIEREEEKRLAILLAVKPQKETAKPLQKPTESGYIPIYVPQYYYVANAGNGKRIIFDGKTQPSFGTSLVPPFPLPTTPNSSDKQGGEK